jgi:hypothetical protein
VADIGVVEGSKGEKANGQTIIFYISTCTRIQKKKYRKFYFEIKSDYHTISYFRHSLNLRN